MSNFQKNLKVLANKYTQKYIAEQTGFSQSSINNYLTKNSEPSIQFLIALKNAFGVCLDDFLFADIDVHDEISYDKFVGNYMVYYYNNNSYKGEVHVNITNTLNYGVISIVNERQFGDGVAVYGTFVKSKAEASKLLKELNGINQARDVALKYQEIGNWYKGNISTTEQSIFIVLNNGFNGDQTFIILNNPPTKNNYIGGVGTANSIARGREHNPCVQFVILSKGIIDKPDGEIYDCLKFDDYNINFDYAIKDIVDLFKRLYLDKNEISSTLTENQKNAIIQNKLEYHFEEILDANVFRFAKISNKEDDKIYKLIKESVDG